MPLLQLSDPPLVEEASDRGRLALDLVACRLLKADAGWDAKHPRTGTAPNRGWFAVTGGEGADKAPKAGETDRSSGADHAFAPPSAASLLSRSLSAPALEGLATLASRLLVPTIVFGALFVPSANAIVDEGLVPGRSDLSFQWAHDRTAVDFSALVDGQWRPLVEGNRGADNLVRDSSGAIVARLVSGPD